MRPSAVAPADHAPQPGSTHPRVPIYRGAWVAACHQREWNGVAASYLDIRSDAAFEAEIPTRFPCLFFTVEAVGGQVLLRPERQRMFLRPAGPLSVVPGGTSVLVRGTARHFRQLVLQFETANRSMRDDGIDLAMAFQPRFMFANARLARLCLLLADECISPDPMDRLFGDSLILSMLMALSRAATQDNHPAGGLAPWKMRRLECFVEAHLGDDLSLDNLAHQVGVSRSHLGRVFKQTIGQSPFEWVRSKRIERAKQLLSEGRLPVAEIAIATGFADQAHLTRAFGRLVGVPPGAWRRRLSGAEIEGVLGAEVQNGEPVTIEVPRVVA
jgi:AraC family transcriptional regulator